MQVLMLLVISLGMPLLLRHHIVVHGIATAIVLSNNSRLCELTEVMLPGSLAVYNEVLGIVLQVSDPVMPRFDPLGSATLGTSASCVAVQSSLQILFGFLLPTIILFLLEAVERDRLLESKVTADSRFARTLEWLLLPSLLLYACPFTVAVTSAFVSMI